MLKLRSLFLLALLALAGSTLQSQAQFPQGSYTNNFATGGNTSPFSGSGSVASWIYWYSAPGGNTPMTNDVTTPDPYGGPGAGSLQVFSPFGTSGNQNLFFGTFGNQYGYDFSLEVNLLNFDTVSFDLFVGTNNVLSPPRADGTFGQMQVGIINANYGWEGFGAGTITISNACMTNWVHYTVPIDHTIANINNVPGLCFNYNSYGTGFPTNNFTFWLGNLVMHYSGAPPPPPTVAQAKAIAGLNQFADAKPSYNRQDVRTDQSGTANVTFYNASGPVTYSWKIAYFPGPVHSNFLAGFTLTPDPVTSQNYSDPDWSATNAIWVAMQNNADGTVTAGIAYKTNQAAGNSQFSNPPGDLVPYTKETNGLTVPSAIGTWSLTVTGNNSFTLKAPNGASTNVMIDPNVTALFNGYVGAFLYSSPTADPNIGQECVFTAYNITGVGTPVSEDFTSGHLASPFLETISQGWYYTGNYTTNPPNQVWVTANDAQWFSWTVPDAGYSPVATANLKPANWNDIKEPSFQNGNQKWQLLVSADLPGTNSGFFAMIQRQFTQLQILLPGETNAPGTSTGKIGTPNPVSLSANGGAEDVTVNAVDATYHMVGGVGDSITLTTSDGAAFLPNGPLNMVNGTVTFTGANGLAFQTQGSQTVTATDNTSTNIAPVTSSPVTVGP